MKSANNHKIRWILSGAICICILAAILILTNQPKAGSLELPYGIKPGMTATEAREKMIDAGLTYIHAADADSSNPAFQGDTLFGLKAKIIGLETENAFYSIGVIHEFDEGEEYSWESPGPDFLVLKDEFSKKYGDPSTELSSSTYMYRWRNGKISLSMYYYSGGTFAVRYSCDR